MSARNKADSMEVDEEEVFDRRTYSPVNSAGLSANPRLLLTTENDRETSVVAVYDEGKPGVQVYRFEEVDASAVEPVDRCGFFCWTPDWMQRFRNMKVFLAVFIVTGLSQGMYYSYWNMTLSSIEKRLQIPSQTTGMITAINDISHLLVVLLVAHFCGKGHRPRWMFVGSLIVGVAVLLFASPEAFAPKWDAQVAFNRSSNIPEFDKETCLTNRQAVEVAPKCDAASQAANNDKTWPILMLALAQILLGIGTTAPIVLVMPFIDDNVSVKNVPLYFAMGLAGRFFGPLIGVLLGGFCLSTYIDLSKTPNIAQSDPRWMGAWYLGYLIIGSLICLTSVLYLFFPARISHTASRDRAASTPAVRKPVKASAKAGLAVEETLVQKLKDMPRDLKRLLVNKIFMCRLFNDCIDMLVVSGYFNFASKYIEFHFRMSPAQAGRASGLSSILAMGLGALVGGILIRRFKFQPKQVAFGILISSFLTAICYFFLMMVRCEPRNLHSIHGMDQMLIVDNACSDACNCAGKPFSPVCYEDTQVNYYSPCHAGCTGVTEIKNVKYYTNCHCLNSTIFMRPPGYTSLPVTVPSLWYNAVTSLQGFILGPGDSNLPQSPSGTVRRGFCEGGCSGFWTYVAISASFKFIGMLPFSGNQMLSFRIVDQDLKALSKALQTFSASLFAFIPGPIIMGALIDSTCRLWNTQDCGKKGACLIYDLDGLRLKMHLYVGIIKTIACVMDIYVYFKVRKMTFEREPVTETEVAEAEKDDVSGSMKDLTKHD